MPKTIKLSLLKSNEKNPRFINKESFETLVKLVEKYPDFLAKRPIVIDSWENPTILAGNMRFKALRKLKYKEVPAEWIATADGMSDEQKEAFMLIDNNPLGQWDFEMLANEFDINLLDELQIFIPNLNMPGDDPDEEAIATETLPSNSLKAPKDAVTVKLLFSLEDFKFFNENIYNHGGTMEAAIINLLTQKINNE